MAASHSLLKAGDPFPDGVVFSHVPFSAAKSDVTACGIPQNFDASADFRHKTAVLVAVPGAFTPTCQVSHLASFLDARDRLRAAGVDRIVVLASNDAWVMAAWGKVNGVLDDSIIFAADPDVAFSDRYGWTQPNGTNGKRTGRYAMLVDHGKVIYIAVDDVSGSINESGAAAILAKLQAMGEEKAQMT